MWRNCANQEEILRWYYYGKELIQVGATIQDGKDGKGEIKEKRQRG